MASYEGVNDILVAHMLTAYVYLSMYFILSLASHFSCSSSGWVSAE